jgi:hypothetical protein
MYTWDAASSDNTNGFNKSQPLIAEFKQIM